MYTKSDYLTFLKCPRQFIAKQNGTLPQPPQDIVSQGYEVEKYAKQLFSGITANNNTEELIKDKKTIFEASFTYKDVHARADILRYNNGWELYEIKSSSLIKEKHLEDLAFQKYVYEHFIPIKRCYMITVNTSYVRKDELELEKLFTITEVQISTEDVLEKINNMRNAVPKDCLQKNCLLCSLPSVFTLYRGGKKALDFFNNNIKEITKLPPQKLTEKQQIQVQAQKTGNTYINKEKIKKWLLSLHKPQYLDFESMQPPIPLFPNTRPFQQICFQYSLHASSHKEFLGKGDPRKEFITSLLQDLEEGSIVVYNKSFEKTRLKEIAKDFPEYKEEIDDILKRVVDLHDIFKNFWYYNPKQSGSTSIKTVLPLFSDLSYDMPIADGMQASYAYQKLLKKDSEKTRNELLAYCKQDTLAEVLIVEQLKEMIKI